MKAIESCQIVVRLQKAGNTRVSPLKFRVASTALSWHCICRGN